MKNWFPALILVVPMAGMALGTETSPQTNVDISHFAAGKKAVEERDWQGAVDALGRAARSNPGNADIQNYLGYAYRNMGKMELAFRHYHEALRLDPDHRGANEYIGWAYLRADRLAQAEQHLIRLEKICGKGCEEYAKLSKGVDDYKAGKKR